ncbi:MAG: hypothetical protein JWR69_3864 [Pedosphaera sp.]|nr:hypothetical protein [Pedosphaera sp.]
MKTRPSNVRCAALFLFVACVTLSAAAGYLQPVSLLNPAEEAPAGGSGDSGAPTMSPDGRYVLFASTANNLVLTSSNTPLPVLFPARLNVFLRDRTNGTTALLSVNRTGTGGGNENSLPTGISTNGQYAVYESSASDLIANDTNKVADVFVRDVVNGTNWLISVSTNGGCANGVSRGSVMTPDGRYVAFVSAASNLVTGDVNGIADVYVRDLQAGTTTLVSVGAKSTNLTRFVSSSEAPVITPDGRYVAFYSTATNLVPGLLTAGEIYVRDLTAGTTFLASANARTIMQSVRHTTNATSYNQVISADGQFVAFEASPNLATTGIILRYSLATGLTDLVSTNANVAIADYEDIESLTMTPDGRFIAFVANTNGTSGATTCINLWDAQTGLTTLVSGNLSNSVPVNSTCDWPAIDPSGRYVAFLSSSTNLTTNALVGDYHLYLRDTQGGTTTLIDADTNGVGSALGPVTLPSLSADARLVAFDYPDGTLVSGDRNRDYDVFVRDLSTNTTEVISARHPSFPSATPNGPSMLYSSSVSANGRFVAFASEAENLVANDTNLRRDVFVRDLLIGTNLLVSINTNGNASGDGVSTDPAISGDGRYVAFTSSAGNLVMGDTNKTQDVFVRDLQTAATLLVSANTTGTGAGNGASYSPVISANGRYVLFRSKANNLTAGSFSGTENLFLRDLQAGTSYALTTSGLVAASMNSNGRFTAFADTAGASAGKIYVWDSQSALRVYTNVSVSGISSVSISPDGNRFVYWAGSGSSFHLFAADRAGNTNWTIGPGFPASHPGLRFSADGRFLTYAASATLKPTNQVYLYDFQTGNNSLVSQKSLGGASSGSSDSPDVSADGRFVAYHSTATDIISTDTNGVPDLFLYDQLNGTTTLLSANQSGTASANNRSLTPVFSGDGQTLFFQSWATDLIAQDFNHTSDLFAFAFLYATVVPGATPAQGPTISWPALPGMTYHVQYKDNLGDANWQEVNGSVTIIDGKGSLVDLAPGLSQRFYRVATF